jgi:hypothetical protein
MRRLSLWPEFDRGSSFGVRYELVNETLKRVAAELDIDLWGIDVLWWLVDKDRGLAGDPLGGVSDS